MFGFQSWNHVASWNLDFTWSPAPRPISSAQCSIIGPFSALSGSTPGKVFGELTGSPSPQVKQKTYPTLVLKHFSHRPLDCQRATLYASQIDLHTCTVTCGAKERTVTRGQLVRMTLKTPSVPRPFQAFFFAAAFPPALGCGLGLGLHFGLLLGGPEFRASSARRFWRSRSKSEMIDLTENIWIPLLVLWKSVGQHHSLIQVLSVGPDSWLQKDAIHRPSAWKPWSLLGMWWVPQVWAERILLRVKQLPGAEHGLLHLIFNPGRCGRVLWGALGNAGTH